MPAKKKREPVFQLRTVRLVVIENVHEQVENLRCGMDQTNGSHVRSTTRGDTSSTSGLGGSRRVGHGQLKGVMVATKTSINRHAQVEVATR